MSNHEYDVQVDVHDPWGDPDEARQEYGLDLAAIPKARTCDAVVLAVAHRAFHTSGPRALLRYGWDAAVSFDPKSVFAQQDSDLRL